jgi:N-acetylglucosamine kinase-like BadF-type ATPase
MKNQLNQGALLGVDVGTSKTHALLTDCTGNVIGLGEAGAGNYEVVGLACFTQAMHKAIQSACSQANINREQILAAGFGISGYDWPSEEPVMIEAIEALGIGCQYRFTNDVLIGLIAGASKGWGVAVDAGTGNNVRGQDQNGRIGRITGNSAWFGEIGGGGEMVWLAQIAVTHAWTQRGPKTRLTQALMAFTGVDSESALIEGLATDVIHLPPILATEIFRIAQEGDPVAREIIITSAHELALNVNAVIQQLELQDQNFDLVLIGSIFKSGEPYLKPFRQTVKSFAAKANLVHLSVPPVVGAVLLAAETIGIKPEDIRETLISTIHGFLISYETQ